MQLNTIKFRRTRFISFPISSILRVKAQQVLSFLYKLGFTATLIAPPILCVNVVKASLIFFKGNE
jgi:hypothetical protein